MQQTASKYANDWRQDTQIQPEITVRRVTRTTRKVNQHRKTIIKCGFAVFAYAVLLVFLCSKSAGLGYDVESLNKEIAKLETENTRLEYQISKESSLTRVEQIASQQLGMQKAEMDSSLAMEVKPEPVKVANNTGNTKTNNVSQKPLDKIYDSLVYLAQKI